MAYIGDFLTKVKQINSQSDLISMTNFAGPSQLTISSSAYIISISDYCIFNLHNLCQTRSNYLRRKLYKCALHFNEQITRTHFFCYGFLLGQFKLKLFFYRKGCQNFASNVTLYSCDHSRQNYLDRPKLSDVLPMRMQFVAFHTPGIV